jgi:hypothetical protein
MSEGFYFRHDSIKNPFYELNREKEAKSALARDKKLAAKRLMAGSDQDLENQITHKVMTQWKTVGKAFKDLNLEKTGKISPNELKFFLNFWGIDVTDEQFEKVFNRFDLDKDGFISYKDF